MALASSGMTTPFPCAIFLACNICAGLTGLEPSFPSVSPSAFLGACSLRNFRQIDIDVLYPGRRLDALLPGEAVGKALHRGRRRKRPGVVAVAAPSKGSPPAAPPSLSLPMMRSATLHTASIAPIISCLPTTTSSSRHSSCAVTPGSTRAGSACLKTPNSDSPASVGTMCFPWATRKPCSSAPPTGPDAGKYLQALGPPRQPSVNPRTRLVLTNDGAVLSPFRASAAANPWLVAAVVVVPTFMEVLDTTIAVVALRYIVGGLSATVDDGEWVITSYLAANVPITGWLSAHLGRRNYFLMSIAVFTISSALCGMAGSLGQLILFRIIQGLAGGGLQPGSQAVLLDAFPREKQGVAMTLFGLAALLAPVVGPTLGGWLTDL